MQERRMKPIKNPDSAYFQAVSIKNLDPVLSKNSSLYDN